MHLARAFSRSGITQTVRLDISKAFDRVWHAGLIEFQVRHLALFLLFSVLNSFKLFWMESLHKNIKLMLEFLKVPFLVLHCSCYTLMTFLMLSVILLSMLRILLSTLSVIRLLNLNLIYKTMWSGVRNGLLISMLGKHNWFHLTSLINMVLLMWKWMGLFLRINHFSRCWGWLSLLNGLELLHYLYCLNCLQENWRFNSLYEVSFSWGCSVSL